MELSIYLGRMPIMNDAGETFAYELLHRSTDLNHTLVDDNIKATARVLVNALNYVGLESLTGYKPAFIKVDEKAICDDLIYSISEKYFVLEVLESSIVSEKLVNRIRNLHDKGYKFALNHYTSDESFLQDFKDIFPYISYVKIDIRHNSRTDIICMLENLRFKDLKTIAEKVEDMDDYEWAQEAGFDFFEGYYFSKPQIYIREMIDPDRQTLLSLLYLLKQDSSLEELLDIFNDSPYLSINLLKFIHMHHGNNHEKIASIDQALILLGREKLSYWVELMIYAQRGNDYGDNNISSPLGKIAKSRASLMQELSRMIDHTNNPKLCTSAYLVGILSLAEAIFQSSFEMLFVQMDLEQSIAKALINKEGLLGDLLKLCIAVENNHFNDIDSILTKVKLDQKDLNKAMILAYQRASRSL